MRTLSLKNILIVAIPSAIVLILAVTLMIVGSPDKTPVVLGTNYVVYDEYDNQYVTSSDIEVDNYWNGDKVIQVEGSDVIIGNISAGIESNNQSATVLTDSVVVMPDNSFYSIDAGTVIENQAGIFKVEDEIIPPGTIIKTGDRQYLVLGDVTSENGDVYPGFMSICLDQTGAPTFATSEQIYRSSQTAILTLENGSKFDVSAETVTLTDGSIIDLKEIGGSSSEYESLTGDVVDPTPTEEVEEESEDTPVAAPVAQPTQNSSSSTSNSNSSSSNNSTTVTETPSNDSDSSDNTSSGGGDSFTITEDMYAFLFEKTPPTGNIMGITDVTPMSAVVNLNVYDSSEALVGSPQVIVVEQETGEVAFSTTVDSTSILITSLQPNTVYNVQIVASYDVGNGIEKRALDTATFETPSISANFTVELLTKETAQINVEIENDILLDTAYISVESGDGYTWIEEQQIPFDTVAASKEGTVVHIENLAQNTMYRVSIAGASYYGVEVPVYGEAVFTTIQDTSSSFEYKLEVAENNITIDVLTTDPTKYSYEYTITNTATGQTDSFLVSDVSSANFNYTTGLIPNCEYVASVKVYEDDVEVSSYTSSEFVMASEIQINNIVNDGISTVVTFSGIPYASNDVTISLNKINEDGSKNEVISVKGNRRLESEIIIDMPLPEGMYTIAYTDESGISMESEPYAYVPSGDLVYKVIDGKILTFDKRNIIVYDANTYEVVEKIEIDENREVKRNTTFVEIYAGSGAIFLVDETNTMYVYSDENEYFSELNGVQIQEVIEKEDEIYVVINEEEVIQIK